MLKVLVKNWRILRSHKIRSTFYTENTLRKLLCKPKDQVATEVTLICLIILISHIAQLLLIRKFYCFRPGRHISFKYVRHKHLHCPMMGEASLET